MMGLDKFNEICNKIKMFEDFECIGGKNENQICEAEKSLGIVFSRQCREFYKRFDYSVFAGIEIFGIQDGEKSSILEGNIVSYTLNDRKIYGLPQMWIPFMTFGDGTMAYYDYSELNGDDEPRIIRAVFSSGRFDLIEQLAEDFGDFLKMLIESVD